MPSTFGSRIRVTLFGQSHAPAIGAVIDGLPAGLPVDEAGLAAFMARRATGGPLSTQRKEADAVEFPAGVVDGRTCGAPVLLMIRNTDARSGDYAKLRDLPRPSHADYAAYLKYRGFNDIRGGGQFSGRLTAPLVAAGYLCRQVLAQRGIVIVSHIARIGGVEARKGVDFRDPNRGRQTVTQMMTADELKEAHNAPAPQAPRASGRVDLGRDMEIGPGNSDK